MCVLLRPALSVRKADGGYTKLHSDHLGDKLGLHLGMVTVLPCRCSRRRCHWHCR